MLSAHHPEMNSGHVYKTVYRQYKTAYRPCCHALFLLRERLRNPDVNIFFHLSLELAYVCSWHDSSTLKCEEVCRWRWESERKSRKPLTNGMLKLNCCSWTFMSCKQCIFSIICMLNMLFQLYYFIDKTATSASYKSFTYKKKALLVWQLKLIRIF